MKVIIKIILWGLRLCLSMMVGMTIAMVGIAVVIPESWRFYYASHFWKLLPIPSVGYLLGLGVWLFWEVKLKKEPSKKIPIQ